MRSNKYNNWGLNFPIGHNTGLFELYSLLSRRPRISTKKYMIHLSKNMVLATKEPITLHPLSFQALERVNIQAIIREKL